MHTISKTSNKLVFDQATSPSFNRQRHARLSRRENKQVQTTQSICPKANYVL